MTALDHSLKRSEKILASKGASKHARRMDETRQDSADAPMAAIARAPGHRIGHEGIGHVSL